MVEWPRSSWIVRRSAPPSNRWVANEWRSVCGVAPGGMPARRVQARRRRRRSAVPSRRPLFERKMARSPRIALACQQRAAALEVGVERAPGLLADRDDALLAALAVHAQLLGVEVGVRRCRAWSAPPRAARSRRRARTSRGRAARAASMPGSSRAAPPTSSSFSTRGRYWSRFGAGDQVGRAGLELARARPGGGRTTGRTRACARPSTSTRRARTGRRRTGAGACGRGPPGARPCAPAHSASCVTSAR